MSVPRSGSGGRPRCRSTPRLAHVVLRALGPVVAELARRGEGAARVVHAQVLVAGHRGAVVVVDAAVGNGFDPAHRAAHPALAHARLALAVGGTKVKEVVEHRHEHDERGETEANRAVEHAPAVCAAKRARPAVDNVLVALQITPLTTVLDGRHDLFECIRKP